MMKNQEDFQDVQDFNGPGEFLLYTLRASRRGLNSGLRPEAAGPRAGLFLSILTYVFRCCSVLERWGVIFDVFVKL